MNILCQDLREVTGLMNATKAALLAKDIFSSLENKQVNILHTRTLLEALLAAYPSSVVSAACAGGITGMNAHLGPLLSAKTSSQTLPTVTHIVLYGCLGKEAQASAEKTMNQRQQSMTKRSAIKEGHRRKFVFNLSEWDFLTKLIDCIPQDEQNFSVGQDVSECLLTIVECLGYAEQQQMPIPNQPQNEPENLDFCEQLFTPLGKPEWWNPLMANLDGEKSSDNTKVASTQLMMGIFTLATGRSSRVRQNDVPIMDATENNLGDADNNSNNDKAAMAKMLPHENKLKDWGLTLKIHKALICHLPQLSHALVKGKTVSEEATTYFERGTTTAEEEIPGTPHPGRYRVIPFTAWRLHAVALFTEIMTYKEEMSSGEEENNNNSDNDNAVKNLRQSAMAKVMEMPVPDPDAAPAGDDIPMNPWPILCHWVFEYPENTLYHFQFIRLFQAVCIEHHEPTLRLVLQKAKFVSKAIKVCKEKGALHGLLLKCLNTLRLRLQSLPKSAFLRQFLDSHDAWKGFQENLIE